MRHRLAAFIVATGLCASGAVACGGGEGPTAAGHSSPSGPATSTGPTASSATSPRASASRPKPPAMPPLARDKSVAGAKAFVRYYVAVMNFASLQNSGRAIRRLATPQCISCRRLANYIDLTAQRGGWQHGGAWSVLDVVLLPAQTLHMPKLAAFIHIASGNWRKSRESRILPIRAQRIMYTFTLLWRGAKWQAADLTR